MAQNRSISQLSTDAAPARTDYLTSLEGQTVNVKALISAILALTRDSDLNLTDITTNDVSIAAHGFAPKAPNDTTKFLRGDATWATILSPASGLCTADLSLTVAYQDVAGCTMSLVAGTWLLVAVATINNTGAAANTPSIKLYNATDSADLTVVRASLNAGYLLPVPLVHLVVLGATKTIRLAALMQAGGTLTVTRFPDGVTLGTAVYAIKVA